MFLTPKELKTKMYAHVIEEITEGDDSIIECAINAAMEEAGSYLASRYDVDKIFKAEGKKRNAMVLENVKVITIWRLIALCNAETIYNIWKERYDRVIEFLSKVAKGVLSPALPKNTGEDGQVRTSMRFGSNPKFNHQF